MPGHLPRLEGTGNRLVSRDQHVEWLTPNPFDSKQPVFWEEGSPWHVTPHWAVVNGRATLVGLDNPQLHGTLGRRSRTS